VNEANKLAAIHGKIEKYREFIGGEL